MGHQLLTTGIWNCCEMIFSIILPIKNWNFPVFREHLHRLNNTICRAIMEQQWRGFTTYLAIDNSSFQNSLVFLLTHMGFHAFTLEVSQTRRDFSDHRKDTWRILVLCEMVKCKHVLIATNASWSRRIVFLEKTKTALEGFAGGSHGKLKRYTYIFVICRRQCNGLVQY